ncbi:hypothetical protein M8494_15455 [Serratia ureilytica]
MRLNLRGITPTSREAIRKSIFAEREMCWDAVVLCAHRSGAQPGEIQQLWQTVFDKQYKHFVSRRYRDPHHGRYVARAAGDVLSAYFPCVTRRRPVAACRSAPVRALPPAIKIFASAWGARSVGKISIWRAICAGSRRRFLRRRQRSAAHFLSAFPAWSRFACFRSKNRRLAVLLARVALI